LCRVLLAGPSFDDFLARVHPGDRDRLAVDVRRAIEEGIPVMTER